MENKMLHIYKDIYACCVDYLNWIPYKKCKITKAEYEKMTPKKQETCNIGDTYYKSLEKYYPSLRSLIEGVIRNFDKEVAPKVQELEEFTNLFNKKIDDAVKEIKKNLKEIKL